MRDALMKSLTALAEKDPKLMLLTGDLGYGVFEEFEKQHPEQYLNIGVAEQNMMGVASGLALEGRVVFTYSIGNFSTLRCLEQIRNDACYHELNVNIISMGGGFSYGGLGMSHHATEDISIMRSLPGVTTLVPSSASEVEQGVLDLYDINGVGYLRLDKSKFIGTEMAKDISIGKANLLRNGNDITLIAAGGVVEECMTAAEILFNIGIKCRVLSLYSIKPIDVDAIALACKETRGIVTIEEGNLAGGLGSAVAEVCMDNGFSLSIFRRFGLNDKYSEIVGSQKYLRSVYKIHSQEIVDYIKKESKKWQK